MFIIIIIIIFNIYLHTTTLLSIRKNVGMEDRTILLGVNEITSRCVIRNSTKFRIKERLVKEYVPQHRVIHLSLVEQALHGSGFSTGTRLSW